MPKGALLVGPPGTGKTLLARAVAGEAGVPFFSASGSEFIEVFVGVGASRVRKLFEQAKAKAPAIIFIDELDAIGKSRSGSHGGGGTDEREQTLNQLLVEMDGFDSRDGIIVLGATNRPEILDNALLRPGRFDRQVLVDRPDGTGRHAILQVHARKVKLAGDVDLEYVARRTPGMVGADLENVLNEAALLAARGEKSEVGMPELHAAIDRVVVGLERKNRLTNTKERRIVAFHEAGHAIVAELAASAEPVHKVSIVPRGLAALGYMQQTPEDRNLLQEDELMDRLAVLLGGRAAEQLAFGKFSTGAANDLERATGLARRMICEFGMSSAMGPVAYQTDGRGRRAGDSGSGEWSEDATGQNRGGSAGAAHARVRQRGRDAEPPPRRPRRHGGGSARARQSRARGVSRAAWRSRLDLVFGLRARDARPQPAGPRRRRPCRCRSRRRSAEYPRCPSDAVGSPRTSMPRGVLPSDGGCGSFGPAGIAHTENIAWLFLLVFLVVFHVSLLVAGTICRMQRVVASGVPAIPASCPQTRTLRSRLCRARPCMSERYENSPLFCRACSLLPLPAAAQNAAKPDAADETSETCRCHHGARRSSIRSRSPFIRSSAASRPAAASASASGTTP